ncbi:MAG: tetratricopeptide repeat protein, partial [Elusimicrobiota bacterium]
GHMAAAGGLSFFYAHGRGTVMNIYNAYLWKIVGTIPGEDAEGLEAARKPLSGRQAASAEKEARPKVAAALKAHKRWAEAGQAWAQLQLGRMHAGGYGGKQDDREAFRWFQKAAEQGDMKAKAELAGMHYAGRGTPKNFAEAAKWYRQAAYAGESHSQAVLGEMHSLGRSVPLNNYQAYFWLKLAEKNGYTANKDLRLEVMKKLSAAQIAHADAKVEKFTAKAAPASD